MTVVLLFALLIVVGYSTYLSHEAVRCNKAWLMFIVELSRDRLIMDDSFDAVTKDKLLDLLRDVE